MPPVIYPDKFIACGNCVDACTEDVFYGSEEGETPVVTYPEFCVHFNSCVRVCPVEGAIELRVPLPLMLLYSEK